MKRSFFERLTGSSNVNEEEDVLISTGSKMIKADDGGWMEEGDEEAELTVDVYQTPAEIIVKSMIAGVKPEDLQISITRDAVTIKGRRNEEITVNEENYFHKELYWGSFSRTITLPEEVEPEEAEAFEKNGLLTIRLPKIDKKKIQKLRVRSI